MREREIQIQKERERDRHKLKLEYSGTNINSDNPRNVNSVNGTESKMHTGGGGKGGHLMYPL
jgi:hypothetical protein